MIGTNLNVADDDDVEVFVGSYSVEMRCDDTEIELYADSLAMFIAEVEEVLPRLTFPVGAGDAAAPAEGMAPGGEVAVGPADVAFRTSSSTWVICETDEDCKWLILGHLAELHWGHLVWTIGANALSRLLVRARRAQTILGERLVHDGGGHTTSASCTDPLAPCDAAGPGHDRCRLAGRAIDADIHV